MITSVEHRLMKMEIQSSDFRLSEGSSNSALINKDALKSCYELQYELISSMFYMHMHSPMVIAN